MTVTYDFTGKTAFVTARSPKPVPKSPLSTSTGTLPSTSQTS